MNVRFPVVACKVLAGLALACAASAQTVYKCGNNYSQTPCPGGTTVDASDARSPAQKAQAEKAAADATKAADKLEKDRLAAQKNQAAPSAKKSTTPTGNKEPPQEPAAKPAKKKKPAPEYFTAAVPPDKKKDKKEPAKAPAGKPQDKTDTGTKP